MTIPQITLASGDVVPALGLGTWFIGDDPDTRDLEITALRSGIEAGMTLVDTAEMYGSGRSEDLVGEAIAPFRDEVYLVDKVLPHNASRAGTIAACEQSLQVLGTDWIDLYLLHWPGPHPVEETVEAFETLKDRGLIGEWGVSNFDADELPHFPSVPLVNQVLYNPSRRGVEFDLLPYHRGSTPPITTMAYSPIEQGRLLEHPAIEEVARRHDATPAQVLLAWAVRDGNTIAIPKSAHPDRVLENARAAELSLTQADLDEIDAAFPAPTREQPLEML